MTSCLRQVMFGTRWFHLTAPRLAWSRPRPPHTPAHLHADQQSSTVNLLKLGGARSMSSPSTMDDFVFRQFFDQRTCTYTYLLADRSTKEAILIDPVVELVDRDERVLNELGLNLIYGVNTHVHADHVTGTGELKKRIPMCRSIIAAVSEAKADIHISEGEFIKFGKFKLECRSTPGHTNGCMTYVLHDKEMAFTGDALLVRGCGRTDFQQGNSATLYDSVHTKIFSLPPQFKLFPAHDYTGQTMTTVEEEKKLNPRLTKTKEDFMKIMKQLNLPYPRFIDEALPANMVCGLHDPPARSDKA